MTRFLFWLTVATLPTKPVARVSLDTEWKRAGAPHISVLQLKPNILPSKLAIGARGELLLAGQSGAAWYDGVELHVLDLPKHGLFANAILGRQDGSILVATNGAGVVRFGRPPLDSAPDEHSLKTGKLPFADAQVLTECANGEVWVGSSGGVARFDTRTPATQAVPGVEGIVTALACNKTDLIVGTEAGLFRIDLADEARAQRLTEQPNSPVRSVLPVDDNRWLVGTEAGIFRLSENYRLTQQPGTNDWPEMIVEMTPWRNELWAALYQKGVVHAELNADQSLGAKWTSLTTEHGLPSSRVWTLKSAAPLSPEVLWGTADTLLFKMVDSGWRWFSKTSPLGAPDIEKIHLAQDGSLWLVGAFGVVRCSGSVCDKFERSDESDQEVLAASEVIVNGKPMMMFGTTLGKAFTHDGASFAYFPVPTEVGNSIRSLAYVKESNGSGSIWFGLKSGLLQTQGGTHTRFTKADGLASEWIQETIAVPNGGEEELWAATYEGVSVRRKNAWTNVTTAEGLPNPMTLLLTKDEKRQLVWAGTPGGLAGIRISDLKIEHTFFKTSKHPTSHVALCDDGVSGVAVAANGDLWVTSNQGVAIIAADLQSSRCITTEDGLPSEQFYMRSLAFDDQANFYAVSDRGVLMNKSTTKTPDSLPPAVSFEAIRTARRALYESGTDAIAYNEGGITFEFVAMSHRHAEQVEYQTQLVGLESQALAWSKERKRSFPSLPSGSYEFRVSARDNLGRTSIPLSYQFSMTPPPWKTWWAFTLYALGLGAAAATASRIRLKQLRRRAEELEQEVLNRTIEIRKQKDEIEAQKHDLEESHKQADRIFQALKQAMPGRIINDQYQIGELLGEGGFGAVYRGRDLRSNHDYAIKIFKPQAGNDSADALERFKGEAKNATAFEHPNTVRIFDFGVSNDGVAFIVMELLDGESLESALKREKKFAMRRALEIMRDTCDVLAAAHGRGVIHRDVKPDNIYLHKDPNQPGKLVVKMLDFGVAKMMKGDIAKRSITMTGAVVGTPTYMAPERLQDDTYDGRSDVYSVGVILYEMLIGRPPFESKAENVFSVVMAHLTQAPPLMTDFDKSIPPDVQALVMKALTKNPTERPTAMEYRDALVTALDSPA